MQTSSTSYACKNAAGHCMCVRVLNESIVQHSIKCAMKRGQPEWPDALRRRGIRPQQRTCTQHQCALDPAPDIAIAGTMSPQGPNCAKPK